MCQSLCCVAGCALTNYQFAREHLNCARARDHDAVDTIFVMSKTKISGNGSSGGGSGGNGGSGVSHFLSERVVSDGGSGGASVHMGALYLRDGSKVDAALKCYVGKNSWVQAELRVLRHIKHPAIVRLLTFFMNEDKVCLLLEPCVGGDLFYRIHYGMPRDKVLPSLWEAHARFYLAELVCALAYLHGNNVAHGDVKVENVLIDAKGHVKLADFDSAVIKLSPGTAVLAVRGSDLQQAPENVEAGMFSLESEMWALGCVAYELLTHARPEPHLFGATTSPMVDEIRLLASSASASGSLVSVSDAAVELVAQLLQVDAAKRPTIERVKQHRFFNGIDWAAADRGELVAPWAPSPTQVNCEEF